MMVSIVIALFNKGPYIRETIQSVQAQTHRTWELIVVDDGSTDDGPECVQKIARRDARIRLLGKANQGPGAARNHGLRETQGEWVLFLDADDQCTPDHLHQLLALADGSHAAVVVSGWRQSYDPSDPGPLHKTHGLRRIRYTSIAYPPWPVGTTIVRREILAAPLLWVESLDSCMSEDTAFWFRIVQRYTPAFSPHCGLWYRLGTGQSRNDFSNGLIWCGSLDRVYADNVKFLESEGTDLHWRHCESLMRSYESLWRRARQAPEQDCRHLGLSQAEHWLREAVRRGGWQRPGIAARWLCGIQKSVAFSDFYRRGPARLAENVRTLLASGL